MRRIRYTSPHPKDMREDVIRAHAELASVCEHIHLPLQAGATRILKAMRRTYTRERYLDRVALIREHVPDVALTTDIIVGFPGETEADFAETLAVAEEVGYDGAFTFIFSPRRGTEAAGLDDPVPHEEKVERMQRLVEVVQRRARERAQRFVGRTLEVLVEGTSRTDPSRLRGRTRHNKVVNFAGLAQPGEYVDVEIAGATSQTLARRAGQPARAEPLTAPSVPICEHMFVRWDGQTVTADEQGRIPGLADTAVVRRFDAPEALDTRFHEIRSKTALNRVPRSSHVPFEWTVNPYRGCSHACVYCTWGDSRVLMRGREDEADPGSPGGRSRSTDRSARASIADTGSPTCWTTGSSASRRTASRWRTGRRSSRAPTTGSSPVAAGST